MTIELAINWLSLIIKDAVWDRKIEVQLDNLKDMNLKYVDVMIT